MNRRANSILFVGPTGSGKSYLSNKIFELCGNNSLRFESSASVLSTTKKIQEGVVTYCGEAFTILDFPGIYDVSLAGNSQRDRDGLNTCNLITTIQSCAGIRAIVFVYSGPRFPIPLKIWYDRIRETISGYPSLSVLVLENKAVDFSPQTVASHSMDLQSILGSKNIHTMRYPYFHASEDSTASTTELLNTIRKWILVRVYSPRILELCYTGVMEESKEFEELISSTEKDIGGPQIRTRTERYLHERMKWDGDLGKIFGWKKKHIEWRDRVVNETVHVPQMVRISVYGIYRNTFKVRFDGTKDFSVKKKIGERTEQINI